MSQATSLSVGAIFRVSLLAVIRSHEKPREAEKMLKLRGLPAYHHRPARQLLVSLTDYGPWPNLVKIFEILTTSLRVLFFMNMHRFWPY